MQNTVICENDRYSLWIDKLKNMYDQLLPHSFIITHYNAITDSRDHTYLHRLLLRTFAIWCNWLSCSVITYGYFDKCVWTLLSILLSYIRFFLSVIAYFRHFAFITETTFTNIKLLDDSGFKKRLCFGMCSVYYSICVQLSIQSR